MHILRFSDLCAQGQARGQRVFIRADLNVPQDDAGRITPMRFMITHCWRMESVLFQVQ